MDYVSPMTPKYNMVEERLKTYRGQRIMNQGRIHDVAWSPAMPIKASDLAEAGFFYTG
jgi:hypothetical protein